MPGFAFFPGTLYGIMVDPGCNGQGQGGTQTHHSCSLISFKAGKLTRSPH